MRADPEDKSYVFSGIFAIIWLGEAVVTLQIKLLGGNMWVLRRIAYELLVLTWYNSAFFQSVCIIGYTLFPLVITSILSAVGIAWLVRIPIYIILGLWSLAAGISILAGSGVVKNRLGLAVFPLLVFYVALDCLCLLA